MVAASSRICSFRRLTRSWISRSRSSSSWSMIIRWLLTTSTNVLIVQAKVNRPEIAITGLMFRQLRFQCNGSIAKRGVGIGAEVNGVMDARNQAEMVQRERPDRDLGDMQCQHEKD